MRENVPHSRWQSINDGSYSLIVWHFDDIFIANSTVYLQQDKSCDECVEMCSLPRTAAGCVHPCERRCHPKPCKPCTVATKIACHCALTQVYFKCNDLYKEDQPSDELDANREKVLSCGNRCIKNVSTWTKQLCNVDGAIIFTILFLSFHNSSHAGIAAQMFVIRVVVKMKNRAGKNWKSIANAKIAKLKRHVTKFGLVSRWSAMRHVSAGKMNWNWLPSSKNVREKSAKKRRIDVNWWNLKRNSAKRNTRNGNRMPLKTREIHTS